MTANKRALLGAGVLALLATASVAHAQSENQQLAQTLFDEGMKLIGEGKYSIACPKLAESQRLDPGGGTLINLALCREREGKLASAWAAYNEALSTSIRDGRKERENAARERIVVIVPKLAHVTIVVPPELATPGFELRLDDAPLRQAAWGVATPADVGSHVITATATGKTAWKRTIEIKQDGESQTITISALDDAPVVKPPEPPPQQNPNPVPETPHPKDTTLAWTIGTIGAAGILTGAISGVAVLVLKSQSNDACVGGCTQQGVDAMNQAQSVAWVSDIAFGVGIAGIAVSAILFVTAKPSPSTQSARVTPLLGPGFAGLTGRF